MSITNLKAGLKIGSVIIAGVQLTLEIMDLIKRKPEPEAS